MEMTDHLSKRARLLAEVLAGINDGNYHQVQKNVTTEIGSPASDSENQDEAVFQKMRRMVYDHVARTVALQRTSLADPPTVDSLAVDFRKLMDELKPETRTALGQAFGHIATTPDSPRSDVNDQLDVLDRYYSEEILEKLDGIVSRASALGRVGLELVPNKRVQLLFEEAHRCYLYGFHLACAVFCRAILEGALREVVDPGSDTNHSIHDMVALADEKHILTNDRLRCAREVAKSGNRAIHDPELFDRDYSPQKVQEILTNTRTVLEELYRQRG
jgi:hypothetical protein